MQKHTLTIEHRQCHIYTTEHPKYLLIQPVDEHDLEVLDKEVSEIERRTTAPFILLRRFAFTIGTASYPRGQRRPYSASRISAAVRRIRLLLSKQS